MGPGKKILSVTRARPTTWLDNTAFPRNTHDRHPTAKACASNHRALFTPPSCRRLLVAARPRLCDHCIGYQRRPAPWLHEFDMFARVPRQTFLRPRPLTARLVLVPIPTCMISDCAARTEIAPSVSEEIGSMLCRFLKHGDKTTGWVCGSTRTRIRNAVETVRCKPVARRIRVGGLDRVVGTSR